MQLHDQSTATAPANAPKWILSPWCSAASVHSYPDFRQLRQQRELGVVRVAPVSEPLEVARVPRVHTVSPIQAAKAVQHERPDRSDSAPPHASGGPERKRLRAWRTVRFFHAPWKLFEPEPSEDATRSLRLA